MPTAKKDVELVGAILCIIGLYVVFFNHDLQQGFLVFGFGMAFMAYGSPSRMRQLFNLFFSMFKRLLKFGSKTE